MAKSCPSDDLLAAFVIGDLTDAEDEHVRLHIDRCVLCRKTLAVLAQSVERTRATVVLSPSREEKKKIATSSVVPGATLGGKYLVDRLLGSGGMGNVFLATHLELAHSVAVKVMHAARLHDFDALRRFQREARAIAALKSEHVIRLFDHGRLATGEPFLVMEHLEGEDLARRADRRPPTVVEVVDWMIQACRGLEEAHRIGLVHRDVKPQNLFLCSSSRGAEKLKLLDFGLVKVRRAASFAASSVTDASAILGSPYFMSPEQVRSPLDVDARSDLWSLGATAYRLIAGRPPFVSETLHGVLARILVDEPLPLDIARPGAPPEIARIVARCLSKDPTHRYASATALRLALEDCRREHAPLPAPVYVHPAPAREWRQPRAPRARTSVFARSSIAIASAAVAFVGVGIFAAAAPRERSSGEAHHEAVTPPATIASGSHAPSTAAFAATTAAQASAAPATATPARTSLAKSSAANRAAIPRTARAIPVVPASAKSTPAPAASRDLYELP